MATSKVCWPDLTFGPVNLFSLPPAWFFYMSREEKIELLHNAKACSNKENQRSEPQQVH